MLFCSVGENVLRLSRICSLTWHLKAFAFSRREACAAGGFCNTEQFFTACSPEHAPSIVLASNAMHLPLFDPASLSDAWACGYLRKFLLWHCGVGVGFRFGGTNTQARVNANPEHTECQDILQHHDNDILEHNHCIQQHKHGSHSNGETYPRYCKVCKEQNRIDCLVWAAFIWWCASKDKFAHFCQKKCVGIKLMCKSSTVVHLISWFSAMLR